MKATLLLSFFAVLSLILSSCDRDQPTPKHTSAWLNHTDGDQLTFREAGSGATRVMKIRVEDLTYSKAAKFDLRSHDYQVISLRYLAQVGFDSEFLRLQFNGDGQVEFGTSLTNSLQFERQAYFTTHKQTNKEQAYGGYNIDLDLLDNQPLHGRTYARIARLRYWSDDRNYVREVWYSKADGLVAYIEPTGEVWQRVW